MKRNRQSRLRHGADPMQPRVYQEPPAPDDSATPEHGAPAGVAGLSGAGAAGNPAEVSPLPKPGTLPLAIPLAPPPLPVPPTRTPAESTSAASR